MNIPRHQEVWINRKTLKQVRIVSVMESFDCVEYINTQGALNRGVHSSRLKHFLKNYKPIGGEA